MAKKNICKTAFGETSHATASEALFRDLCGRAPEIRHLWSHQADLLRAYHQHYLKARDMAIELPAGGVRPSSASALRSSVASPSTSALLIFVQHASLRGRSMPKP
jgi:hypothetical protein